MRYVGLKWLHKWNINMNKKNEICKIGLCGEDGLSFLLANVLVKNDQNLLGKLFPEGKSFLKNGIKKVFYRPSFGRGQYGLGEPDMLIVSEDVLFVVESKWSNDGNGHSGFEEKDSCIRFARADIRWQFFRHAYVASLVSGLTSVVDAETIKNDFKKVITEGKDFFGKAAAGERRDNQRINDMRSQLERDKIKEVKLIFIDFLNKGQSKWSQKQVTISPIELELMKKTEFEAYHWKLPITLLEETNGTDSPYEYFSGSK